MTKLTFIVMPDGKLPIGIKETLARIIPDYAGKKMTLEITEAKDKRSLDANAYYWGVIVPHVRKVRYEAGDPLSVDAVHEDLLAQFAPLVDGKRLDGTEYKRNMRSKAMNVAQFAEYCTAITATMAEFGSPVPLEGGYGY